MHEQLQCAQTHLLLLCHGWESILHLSVPWYAHISQTNQSSEHIEVFFIMLFWRIVIFRKGNKEIHTLWLVAKILKCICTDTIIITVNVHNYSVLVYISLTLKFSLNLEEE